MNEWANEWNHWKMMFTASSLLKHFHTEYVLLNEWKRRYVFLEYLSWVGPLVFLHAFSEQQNTNKIPSFHFIRLPGVLLLPQSIISRYNYLGICHRHVRCVGACVLCFCAFVVWPSLEFGLSWAISFQSCCAMNGLSWNRLFQLAFQINFHT